MSHLDGRSHIRQRRTCSKRFFKISLGHLKADKAGNRTGHLLSVELLRFVLSSSAQIAAVILPALDRLPAQATCRSWGAIPEFKRHNAGPMGYMAGMGFWVFPQYYCSCWFRIVCPSGIGQYMAIPKPHPSMDAQIKSTTSVHGVLLLVLCTVFTPAGCVNIPQVGAWVLWALRVTLSQNQTRGQFWMV